MQSHTQTQVLLEAGNFPQGGLDANTRKVGPSGGQAIATEALVTATMARYKPLYAKAKAAYEAKLWNGKYFNYDSSGSYQVTRNDKLVPSDCVHGAYPLFEGHKRPKNEGIGHFNSVPLSSFFIRSFLFRF